MTDVALRAGHLYRAALRLSVFESAFSGALPGQLEALGFSDVQVWDDLGTLPNIFGAKTPDLTRSQLGATHWAQGIFGGKDGERKTLPEQIVAYRDDGAAASSSTVKPLPGNAPTSRPTRPGGNALPMPLPGQPDQACEAGYTRISQNSACFALVTPGAHPNANPPPAEGLSTPAKVGIAVIVLGGSVGLLVLVVDHVRKPKKKRRIAA